jgi:Protein of unknown function (DUF3606)
VALANHCASRILKKIGCGRRELRQLSNQSYLEAIVLSAKHPPARNLIDLADSKQVRVLIKRLGISEDELRRMVEKSGNSIVAITKEAEFERTAKRSSGDKSEAC